MHILTGDHLLPYESVILKAACRSDTQKTEVNKI